MSNIPSPARMKQLRAIELEAIRVCAAFTALERNIENPSEWRELTKRVVELNARLEAMLECIGGPLDTAPHAPGVVNVRQRAIPGTGPNEEYCERCSWHMTQCHCPKRRPYATPRLRRLPGPPSTEPAPLEQQDHEPSE